MGIDKFTSGAKYSNLIYESAGTAEQLGKEIFFNRWTKTIGYTMEKLKSDPYFMPNKKAISDGIDPINT